MFTNNTFWKWVGDTDANITAPLTGLIMLLLIISYGIFLNNTTEDMDKTEGMAKRTTIPIYVMGIFYTLIGALVWFIKTLFYPTTKSILSNKDKAAWTSAHTFFHYTSYTGTLLIILLYYIENKNIYQTLQNITKKN